MAAADLARGRHGLLRRRHSGGELGQGWSARGAALQGPFRQRLTLSHHLRPVPGRRGKKMSPRVCAQYHVVSGYAVMTTVNKT